MSPAFVRTRAIKIRRKCAFVSYAFTFLHNAATFHTVFSFFLANQTFFKDEFLLTPFFVDDQFFDTYKS
jgi:hypothetical protein